MPEHRELPIPPRTQQAERAQEVLRVWINPDKSMDVSLMPAFYETGLWGILLFDVAHRVGEAYAAQTGLNKDEVVASIRTVFNSGFEQAAKPTPTPPKKK